MEHSIELFNEVDKALARLAIHDLLMAQASGTDRRDLNLLSSLWHNDATVAVGFFRGAARAYPEALMSALSEMSHIDHSVANEWIEV